MGNKTPKKRWIIPRFYDVTCWFFEGLSSSSKNIFNLFFKKSGLFMLNKALWGKMPRKVNFQLYPTLLPQQIYLFIKLYRISYKQIYSIDVYTDNYLLLFFNDLIRLLANCFLLLGCINIPNTIGWFLKAQWRVGTRTFLWVKIII